MYNEELKNRFLNNYSKDSARIYLDSLMQISEAEEFYNKDVFDFNYDELNDAFKSMRTKSLAGVRRVVSPVRKYITWANENGFVKTKIDISCMFSNEKLNDYIWKYAEQNSYVYREEMYSICERLVNDVDKAIVVLAFEGIDGKGHFEMTNLRSSDIDFGSGRVNVVNADGEKREIFIEFQESLEILRLAQKQDIYIPRNGIIVGKAKNEENYLADSNYIVRKVIGRRTIDDGSTPVISTYLAGKVTRFFKGKKDPVTGKLIEEPFISDCEFLNLNNIFKSGFFDYCTRLEEKSGMELDTAEYEKACERYGINKKLVYSYKKQYLNWKHNIKK